MDTWAGQQAGLQQAEEPALGCKGTVRPRRDFNTAAATTASWSQGGLSRRAHAQRGSLRSWVDRLVLEVGARGGEGAAQGRAQCQQRLRGQRTAEPRPPDPRGGRVWLGMVRSPFGLL